MYQHAKDLEFEAAAKIRDEMKRIRDAGLLS
jgi:excinuclease UvrABC helicase subunit UvrB